MRNGLIRLRNVLVGPPVRAHHGGEGVEGGEFGFVSEVTIPQRLLQIGERVHRFDDGAELYATGWG